MNEKPGSSQVRRTPLREGRLRALVKRSVPATCAAYLARSALTAARFRLGRVETDSGTIHRELSAEQSIQYINDVFDDYKRYGGIEQFSGRVAEIGPGDSAGVGLLFRADGCPAVDLVDRFFSRRDESRQALIYRRLAEQNHSVAEVLQGADLSDEVSFSGIKRWYGPQAAAESFFTGRGPYRFIVSRAVCEHLQDPIGSLSAMAATLEPRGMLLHKVDLRDHNLFSEYHDELCWLTIPQIVYRAMVMNTGQPNRVMLDRYRSWLQTSGLEYQLLVTRLAGVGDMNPHRPFEDVPLTLRDQAIASVARIRPSLARQLRASSDEDLAVTGFFLVARRPG